MNVVVRACLVGAATATGMAFGAIEIRSDYPGGNVKVLGIDETNGVVRVAPDLRDTEGKWFHFDFTVRGTAGRTLRFQFPQDKYEYLSSLGPAISRDGGATWTWLNADGTRYKPINYFNYAFAPDESETRFALSIPYTQKNWDAASVRWRGKDGVELGVLCKSQSGKRDTEMLRIRCRKEAKWLFAFTARHHACETTANPVMEGIIDEIISGSPEGEWIRDNADCVFIPFMDKDGVENGDQGKNRRPHDHNRDYIEGRYTSVRVFKELIERESSGRQIVFFDLHSPNQRGGHHETAHSIGCGWLPEENARWHRFRRNWIKAQKGGRLSYDGKRDYVSTKKGHDGYIAKGFSTARGWVQDRPNCWLSVCCEFGYSLCGGVYSQDGGRELGHSLLKAAVRTVREAVSGANLIANGTFDSGELSPWTALSFEPRGG